MPDTLAHSRADPNRQTTQVCVLFTGMSPRQAINPSPAKASRDESRDLLQHRALEVVGTLRTERLIASRLVCDRTWADRGQREYNDPFGRIFCLAAGGARVMHHGRTFEMRPGWLYAIPAFTPSRYICDNRMDLFYLHYRADVLGALEPFEYFGWDFAVPARPAGEVRRIWDRIIRQGPSPTTASVLDQDAAVRQFLALFAATRRHDIRRSPSLHRFHPVFSHVERNLHRPLPLAELAALVHLHPTYFSNTFTQSIGMTPVRYVTRKRIERAQNRLLGSTAPIKEIAAGLGFADVFYFSRTFRRIVGVPPSDYRAFARSAP